MRTGTIDHGVYYDASDYIGVWRRCAIDLVDIFVAVALSIVVSTGVSVFLSDRDEFKLAALCAWVMVWCGYFVFLKRSSLRTVGYRLAKARIINLQGSVPSVASLGLRLLFAIFGPLNLLFDLFWIPSDPSRQALRDKFAHTYVIRLGAMPAGKGPIGYTPYSIFGASYIFQEVGKPNSTIAA